MCEQQRAPRGADTTEASDDEPRVAEKCVIACPVSRASKIPNSNPAPEARGFGTLKLVKDIRS
jgi:hypothetical protein